MEKAVFETHQVFKYGIWIIVLLPKSYAFRYAAIRPWTELKDEELADLSFLDEYLDYGLAMNDLGELLDEIDLRDILYSEKEAQL